MNVVKFDEYENDKKEFFRKHKNDFRCETSNGSAEYYNKTYVFDDGAIWYEVMRKVYENIKVEIYYISIPVEVELFQTEYWSSDNADSKVYYEPWDVKK